MITHDQLIFVIRSIYPQIKEEDHGHLYLVGMPVEGDTQIADAGIMRWDFEFAQPTKTQIAAKWAAVRDDYEYSRTAAFVRADRDRLLGESDWVVTRSLECGDQIPESWANYRQALRDVPQQEGFPHTIVWPEAPNA